MERVLLAVALAALMACDAPWSGPTLPSGAHSYALRQLSPRGPLGIGPDIFASTSLADVRAGVISRTQRWHPASVQQLCQARPDWPDPCWLQLDQPRAFVYIAVLIVPPCTAASKEASALGDHTLYFIYWVGNPNRGCQIAAMTRFGRCTERPGAISHAQGPCTFGFSYKELSMATSTARSR